MILAYVAISLHKAGDMRGLDGDRAASGLRRNCPTREKQGAMAHIARAMAETGDMDGALELIPSLESMAAKARSKRSSNPSPKKNVARRGCRRQASRSRSGSVEGQRSRQHESAAQAHRAAMRWPIPHPVAYALDARSSAGEGRRFRRSQRRLESIPTSSARIILVRATGTMTHSSRGRWPSLRSSNSRPEKRQPQRAIAAGHRVLSSDRSGRSENDLADLHHSKTDRVQ